MKIKTGDIIIIWRKNWISRFVAFCITSVFGVIDPPVHTEMAIDEVTDISAEKWKVKLVDREKTLKTASRFMVIRYKKIKKPERCGEKV